MRKYILILGFILLVGCSQEVSGDSDISKEINGYLGMTPFLPDVDYPMGHVYIEYSPIFEDGEPVKGEPRQATVEYKVSLDEKVNEEFRESWDEGNPLWEIIHGDLYEDDTAIIVNVEDSEGHVQGAEIIEIEGHEVQYQHIERETEAVFMHVNFEDISYGIHYLVAENDIEEEAKAFAKEIINNH